MIFGQDRDALRRMYIDAWRKASTREPLSALETQIAGVISDHPEYQPLMNDASVEAAFSPEEGQANPFLHMGLHLAVRDQVATDRPPGITLIYNELLSKVNNNHDVEHRMLDCLAESLWEAQRGGGMPDEAAYLARLRRL